MRPPINFRRPRRHFERAVSLDLTVLALKLAEVKVIEEKLGCAPLLLLDDVSSELDKQRTEYLFKCIEELGCQVWISTTGSVELQVPEENHHFRIEQGALKIG